MATAHASTFESVESAIACLIHIGLSLSTSAAATVFRDVLRGTIRARISLRGGALSAEAQSHKACVLKIFLSSGRNRNFRRTMLTYLANGDWRDRQCVQYFPRPHEDITRVPHMLANGIVSALFGSQVPLWPRSRWKGADIVVSQIALLDSVHGLLSAAYPVFCQRIGATAGKAPPCVYPPRAGGGAPIPPVEDAQPAQAHVVNSDGPAHRHEQERWRSASLAFLKTDPLGMLMTLRFVLEPLRLLLDAKLFMSSKRWERQQLARAARASTTHGPEALWLERDFRLVVSASNSLEQRFFNQVAQLSSPALFIAMPPTSCNERECAIAFILQSKSGCLVEELLAHPHRCFPYRTLLLLQCDIAEEFLRVPRCVLDAWSAEFRDKFGTALTSVVARVHLFTLCHLGFNDIARIEALHATTRRLLKQRVQTHSWGLAEASAMWLCGRQRTSLPPAAAIDVHNQHHHERVQRQRRVCAKASKPLGGGGGGLAVVLPQDVKW